MLKRILIIALLNMWKAYLLCNNVDSVATNLNIKLHEKVN